MRANTKIVVFLKITGLSAINIRGVIQISRNLSQDVKNVEWNLDHSNRLKCFNSILIKYYKDVDAIFKLFNNVLPHILYIEIDRKWNGINEINFR